jgi:serine/threonine-protein kinase
MDLQIGSTVGDYQIVGVLGAGGMGSVYQVRNLISDRVDALKVLLPDLTGDPDLAERFQREIKVQASLEHPNIAALRTAFRSGNQLLMVMEFVDGVTLEEKLKDGPLPVLQAIDAIRQVLSALEFAHSRGIIHRDIKPANIILTKAGVVKLMDFGIAKAATDHKLTMTGTTLGSLYYMSPEQIQGVATLDARADLYSVGVTLYQLVTGKRPFDGDSQYAIMAAHLEKAPVPPVTIDPHLPQALNDVILMSVAKDPNGRFQSATAFGNALGAVAATIKAPTEPVVAPPPSSPILAAQPTPAPAPFATAPQAAPMMAQGPAPVGMAPVAPVAPVTPAPMRPPAARAGSKSKRGLWMALGGIAAAAAIVAAIEFGPWKGARADSAKQQQAAVTVPVQPPVAAPADTTAAQTQSAAATPQPVASVPPAQQTQQQMPVANPTATKRNMVGSSRPQEPPFVQPQPVQAPPQQQAQQEPPPQPRAEPQPVVPPGPSRAEMTRAREHVAKMQIRADAVRTSLQALKRIQQANGMTLNARFTQPEGLMNTYLRGANEALNAEDLPAFRDYANKAERQLEILEKLLNL